MNVKELMELPFHDYMAYRTKFAVDRIQRDKVIDPDYDFIALCQAIWARDYWVHKVQGEANEATA